MQTLRPYQETAVASVLREWETTQATLGVAATGMGKTTIFTELVKRTGKRAIVLCHRTELVHQAAARLRQFGVSVDVEQGDKRAATGLWGRSQVIVATPQTMFSGRNGATRMQRFRPEDFGIVIVDEAHHYVSEAFHGVVAYFKAHPQIKVFGCTATPDRADCIALAKLFDTVAFDIEIEHGIDDGWLVPIRQQLVRIEGLDFSAIRTTAGDLNGADLARVMEAEKTMQGVAGATIDICGDKRTLVFTASVLQAEQLAGIFNRHRPGKADWIHGGTNRELRAESLKRFGDGETQIMVNCSVLTEGYDNPAVECVVMAKPTKSRSLYAQMVGRGTRSLPGVIDPHETAAARREAITASGKPFLTVLDFVGNSGRHKLVTAADVLGGKTSEEAKALARKRMEETGEAADVREELAKAEIDILREIEEAKRRQAADKAHLVARVEYSATYIDPFDSFTRRAEKYEGHVQTRLSEKQRTKLVLSGCDPDRMTIPEAVAKHWDLIRASDKQRSVLYRYYPPEQVDKMPKWEASKCIDAIAKNGWKKL